MDFGSSLLRKVPLWSSGEKLAFFFPGEQRDASFGLSPSTCGPPKMAGTFFFCPLAPAPMILQWWLFPPTRISGPEARPISFDTIFAPEIVPVWRLPSRRMIHEAGLLGCGKKQTFDGSASFFFLFFPTQGGPSRRTSAGSPPLGLRTVRPFLWARKALCSACSNEMWGLLDLSSAVLTLELGLPVPPGFL